MIMDDEDSSVTNSYMKINSVYLEVSSLSESVICMHSLLKSLQIKTNRFIFFYAGREAIMSQFRVWPFLSTIIMTFGERNRNPGHRLAIICHQHLI